MLDTIKTCTKCSVEKPITGFYKHIKGIDGLRTYCKDCSKQYNKDNASWIKEKNKQYRQKNAEYFREYEQQRNLKKDRKHFLSLNQLKEKYVGFKSNKLTVLEITKHSKFRGYVFKCQCDCGNEVVCRREQIITGKQQSCGCSRKENAKKRILPNNQSAINSLFYTCKAGAKNRGYEFCLSEQEFSNLIFQKCHYCGIASSSKGRSKSSSINVNGLDRKDNNIGYTINNCVPCCTTCNRIKHVLSYNDFLNHIENILKHLGKI
jgi:hypothetical protein